MGQHNPFGAKAPWAGVVVNQGLRLGGLRNPPQWQEGHRATTALSNWEGAGGMETWCCTAVALSGRGGVIDRRHGLQPDWGERNGRNFSGGAGNVSAGRTRTPLHSSKEGRAATLDLRLCAPVLYSTAIFEGESTTLRSLVRSSPG